MSKRFTEAVKVLLTPEQKECLETWAWSQGLNMSEAVRQALEEAGAFKEVHDHLFLELEKELEKALAEEYNLKELFNNIDLKAFLNEGTSKDR